MLPPPEWTRCHRVMVFWQELKWTDNGQWESGAGAWNPQSTCYLLTRYCLLVPARFNRFVQNEVANSFSVDISMCGWACYSNREIWKVTFYHLITNEAWQVRTGFSQLVMKSMRIISSYLDILRLYFNVRLMLFASCSSSTVQLDWQVQETENCVHKSAAAGAGASVQTEQVSVTTEALWSSHVPHAHRNSSKSYITSKINSKLYWNIIPVLTCSWRFSEVSFSLIKELENSFNIIYFYSIVVYYCNTVFLQY